MTTYNGYYSFKTGLLACFEGTCAIFISISDAVGDANHKHYESLGLICRTSLPALYLQYSQWGDATCKQTITELTVRQAGTEM